MFIQRPCLNEHDCILCMQIHIFSITPCQASNGSRGWIYSGKSIFTLITEFSDLDKSKLDLNSVLFFLIIENKLSSTALL